MKRPTDTPIVYRWVRKNNGSRHGGAWKIAYADFVTAMMAFFLLMWLMGSTTQGDLKGIADYFQTPFKVARFGGPGSGDASSVIAKGGEALTRSHGDIHDGAVAAEKKVLNLQRLSADYDDHERKQFADLANQLEKMLASSEIAREFKDQLLIDIISEGIRIQLIDERSRPMFDTASALLKPHTRAILRELAPVLNGVNRVLSITGHTDAAPYAGGEKAFGNWELSANRANAARRELVAGGLAEQKIQRVVGLGSVLPFNKLDPLDPANRRISMVILNTRAQEEIQRDAR